jgi:formamidopyrimidine-DNA glycosylase
MPELPEVETIAREIHSRVAGATITGLVVRRPDVLREIGARAFANRLTGKQITRCWRRAKYAVLDISDGNRICVQPRFTGALLVEKEDQPFGEDVLRYSTLHLGLQGGRKLHYYDVRRLGTVTFMTPPRFDRFMLALGVEPLAAGFTPDLFSALLRESEQAVKKFIMNQAKLAGVGNIYANEALWLSGIDPSKPARKVDEAGAHRLHQAIVTILNSAIQNRGTSIRDYRYDVDSAGENAAHLKAYGRAGLPCPRCGHKMIGTHAIDGRATVFCAVCQR